MASRKPHLIATIAVLLASAPLWSQTPGETVTQVRAKPEDTALAELRGFSAASQALSQKIAGSLVRVRVEQHLDTLIPEQFRSAWEDFQRNPQFGSDERSPVIVIEGARGKGDSKSQDRKELRRDFRPNPAGNRGENAPRRPHENATSMPARPGFVNAMLLERFLELRTRSSQPDVAAEAQALVAKVRAVRTGTTGDMYAAVYDSSGHALLLTALALPPGKTKLTAYLPDGTEVSANILATDFRRGLTYLSLENAKSTAPAALAVAKPAPGEFLACVSASSGTVTWFTTPLANPSRRREERFAVAGFDDRAGFVFNTDGQLVALSLERMAMPVAAIQKEIAAGEAGKILEPRPLGVKYEPVPMDSPERAEHKLGQRPAVRVTDVLANSPAQWAGVQKGDYVVSIDGRSVLQMRDILRDLATKTTPVRIGLVRGEEQIERELPLEKPADKTPERPRD